MSLTLSRHKSLVKGKHFLVLQAAQKPAEAETRTQFLTREQVVKILEFLHQDDE